MAAEKAAIKTQLKALVPGTDEHKARKAGDPAYHLGNVGSHDHRVHTGFGLTGKLHPTTTKAHAARDHTKEKLSKHVHKEKLSNAKHALHSHTEAPAGSSDASEDQQQPSPQQQLHMQQMQRDAPGAAGEMLKGLGMAPK